VLASSLSRAPRRNGSLGGPVSAHNDHPPLLQKDAFKALALLFDPRVCLRGSDRNFPYMGSPGTLAALCIRGHTAPSGGPSVLRRLLFINTAATYVCSAVRPSRRRDAVVE
jgi:hypothetical protein